MSFCKEKIRRDKSQLGLKTEGIVGTKDEKMPEVLNSFFASVLKHDRVVVWVPRTLELEDRDKEQNKKLPDSKGR